MKAAHGPKTEEMITTPCTRSAKKKALRLPLKPMFDEGMKHESKPR